MGVENVFLALEVVGVGVLRFFAGLAVVLGLGVVGLESTDVVVVMVVAALDFVLRFLNLSLRFRRRLCIFSAWRVGVVCGTAEKIGVGADLGGCVLLSVSKLGDQSAYISLGSCSVAEGGL